MPHRNKLLRAQVMKRQLATFILLFLSGYSIAEQSNLSGLFITNNQGAEYENTITECSTGKVIRLSGKEGYDKFIELYFSLENLSEYGELYVDLIVKDYKVIDKKLYPHSHYDAMVTFVSVVEHSTNQERMDKCQKSS
jgi:hypothetical protein